MAGVATLVLGCFNWSGRAHLIFLGRGEAVCLLVGSGYDSQIVDNLRANNGYERSELGYECSGMSGSWIQIKKRGGIHDSEGENAPARATPSLRELACPKPKEGGEEANTQ